MRRPLAPVFGLLLVLLWVPWAAVAAPPAAAPDLAPALAALAAAPAGEPRMAAAQTILAAGAGAIPHLAELLSHARASTDAARRAVLVRIGASVPDTTGVFRQPPRPVGAPTAAPDWLAQLAQISGNDRALVDSLEIVTLLRALAATRQTAAAEAIMEFAFSASGITFRDECGRLLRQMAPDSFPALLTASGRRDRDKGSYARYASYQLDRLEKGRPELALASAPNDELVVAMLRAIRDVKHPDAVQAVLVRTDSPSYAVRRAARDAWLAYVTGPAPPPAPKAKRHLPGGQQTPEEMPLYLTFRELADEELRRELTDVTGNAPSRKATAEEMTKELFAHYDDRRASRWDAVVAEAAELAKAGRLADVGARYDRILLEDPTYGRRAALVPGYLELGRALASQKDFATAVAAFHKAVSIDPEGPNARVASAELHVARSMLAGDHGDEELEVALAVAPDLRSVEQAFATRTRARRTWMLYAGTALGILAAACLALAWRRRRFAR